VPRLSPGRMDSVTGPRPAALLLTGGASRRMGRDKALIDVDGSPLWRRTAELLALVADPVVEVGPGYSPLPRAVEPSPGSGPLHALAAGAHLLRRSGHLGPVLLVATDLPRLSAGLLDLLASWPGTASVVPLAGGQPQPLCARYSGADLATAAALVEAGHRSLRSLLDRIEATWLEPVDWVGAAGRADALADIDTPEDLAALDP
jgi:molybdenum cofactor guanylyltransferase